MTDKWHRLGVRIPESLMEAVRIAVQDRKKEKYRYSINELVVEAIKAMISANEDKQ